MQIAIIFLKKDIHNVVHIIINLDYIEIFVRSSDYNILLKYAAIDAVHSRITALHDCVK